VRDWAVESGRPIPPLAGPLVDLAVLAPVHDDPGQDLRKRLGAYRAVLARFEKLDPQGAWTAVTRRLVADLGRIQRQREKHADTAATSINILFNKPGGVPEYKRVLELWERISDSEGRLRYTAAYESQRKDLAKTAKACRDVIDQQELLQLFHGGVDIEERPGDRQRITFDFDDAPQMDNFTRCFGELVPTGGPITPVARGYRLMLLKGVQGLLFDRPLALYNMFDTGQKISVEFTIDTRDRRGASILAIDIDGVQIAVSSLDPNYWRWRFPRDIPLVEGEAAPPQFDFYGRGRGVAFHEGREFGRSFPLGNWTWDKLSDAADFEKWKDRSYIKKHRAKLFAFAPGQTYRVRIERERDTMRLIVDDELIVQKKMASWGYRGKHATGFRNGSGMIQILTLTPLAIDNLVFEGHVTDRWRAQRKREIKARDAAREKAGEREGRPYPAFQGWARSHDEFRMMNLKPGEQASGYDTRHYVTVTGLGDLAEGQLVTINLGESIVVGRSRHCDWSLRRTPSYLKMPIEGRAEIKGHLAYNSVSRKHARISYVAPDMVEVKNLSGNGTLVDGRLVDKIVLTDCRENSHKIQLGPKGIILMIQPGSLPI